MIIEDQVLYLPDVSDRVVIGPGLMSNDPSRLFNFGGESARNLARPTRVSFFNVSTVHE